MKRQSQIFVIILVMISALCTMMTVVYARDIASNTIELMQFESESDHNSDIWSAGLRPHATEGSSSTGMKRVVLSSQNKNKPILSQKEFKKANTIYIIEQDFSLAETINMPANCILEFNGGSFKGGTIIGNNTSIIAGDYAIFNDCVIKRFNLPYVDPRWVGAVPDFDEKTNKGTDNSVFFQRAYDNIVEYHPGIDILIIGKYLISKTVTMRMQCHLRGVHNNTRGLIIKNRLEGDDGTSNSLIAIGACPAFRVVGNENVDKTWSDFSIEHVKFSGLNREKSIAIQYEASGSPTRPAIIEKCEANNLLYFLYAKAKEHSVIGSLTIKENNIYNCTKAIYVVPEPITPLKMGLASLKIENNVIEHNGDKCIYLNGCFGPIIIDNNVLEGETNPIFITNTCDMHTNYVISNNYFEYSKDNDKKIHIDGVISRTRSDFDHVRFLTSVEIFGNTSVYGFAVELNGVVVKRLDRIETPTKGGANYSVFTRCLFEDIDLSDVHVSQFNDWNFSSTYPTSKISRKNSIIGESGNELLSFDDGRGNMHSNKSSKVMVNMTGDNGSGLNMMITKMRPHYTKKTTMILLKHLFEYKEYNIGVSFPREIPYYAFLFFKKNKGVNKVNYHTGLNAYNDYKDIELSHIVLYKNVEGPVNKYPFVLLPYE